MSEAAVRNEGTSALLQQARAALEEALRPHGFRRSAPTHQVDGVTFDEWTRAAGWKTDMVALSYRGAEPTAVTVGVSVSVADPRPGGGTATIDGVTVGFLAGRDPFYELPRGLFLSSKERRFVGAITSDAVRALGWFEQYATPEKCLARLDSDDRNGPRKGSPLLNRVVEYLREVPR